MERDNRTNQRQGFSEKVVLPFPAFSRDRVTKRDGLSDLERWRVDATLGIGNKTSKDLHAAYLLFKGSI